MDIAAIGLKVDSSGVIVAVDKLNEFVTASQRAESASTELANASSKASAAAREEAATQSAVSRALQSADAQRLRLIQGLQQQIAVFGRSKTEVAAYEAEMLGISRTVAPLIGELDRLKTAQLEAARAQRQAAENARIEAQAQADIARSLAATDTERYRLIEGLKQEIASFGKSALEMKAYEAELLGVTASTRPLIAQLEQMREAQRAANAEARQGQQQQSFLGNLREQSETYGKSTSEILAYRAAQLGVTQQAAPLIEKIRQEEEALRRTATAQRGAAGAAGLHSAAMRQLPAQITDIVTSLISGQPAYLVAIQQGGQLKDSFGGIAPAMRALVSAINPVTLALGAAAAVVGTLAYGFVKGTQESTGLTRSLILTGNQVGQTTSSLNAMAKALDEIGGTRSQAAEALTALINVGRVAGEDLQRFAAVAVASQEKLGLSVEDTAKQFAALGKDPLTASLRLNEAMHFLTVETIAQIQAFERQGNTIAAAKLAQDAFADALATRSAEMQRNLGYVERAWQAIKKAVGETGDAILEVGRQGNEGGTIDKLIEFGKRAYQTSFVQAVATTVLESRIQQKGPTPAEAARQQQEEALAAERALAGKDAAAATDAQAAALTKLDQVTTSLATKQEQYNTALAQTKAAFDALKGTKAEVSPEDQAKVIQRLKESIFGRADSFGPRIADVQRQLDAQVDAINNAENRIETLHSARRLKDEDYYSEQIRLVQESVAAQVAALTKENGILAQQAALEDARDGRSDQTREKIRANTAEITRITQQGADKQGQIILQQQVAQEALRRSYELSKQAAVNALAVQGRALDRQLQDIGAGPAARRFTQGRNQIEEGVANQRFSLEQQRISGQVTPEVYDQQLSLLQKYQDAALDQWDSYYGALEERSQDFTAGFSDAILEYLDQTKNLGAQIGGDLVNAIDSAKDSTADLAANMILWGKGGENAAKAIARSLITDLVSSLIKVGLQMGVNFLLGQTLGAASTATSAAAATALGGIWAPAAFAANVATLGGASEVGLATYLAGLGATTAAQAATAGAGGLPGKQGGGWTGEGPVSKVAGVHHYQEFVVKAGPAAQYRSMLEGINQGVPWMAHRGSGGSGATNFQIVNAGSPMRVDRTERDGDTLVAYVDNRLDAIEDEIAAGIYDGTGSVHRAVKDTFGIQRGAQR